MTSLFVDRSKTTLLPATLGLSGSKTRTHTSNEGGCFCMARRISEI